ncbi:MAG: TIGR00153 family protein [bacterium]|jgi:hypothetical protein
MRNILAIFSRSPLGPLHEMMAEIEKVMEAVPGLLDAVARGDAAGTKEIAKGIMHDEHQIDLLKDEIRANLPKSLFLPFDRKDFLKLLHEIDGIPDDVEDLAALFTLREMAMPEGLEEAIRAVWTRAHETFGYCKEMIENLDDLIAAGFHGPKADEFIALIDKVNTCEWETDKRAFKATQALLALEGKESPIAIVMWMKIIGEMSDIADRCEGLSKTIRLMLAV